MAKRQDKDAVLARYLNSDGLVSQYPSRLSQKLIVLNYIADRLEAGRIYTEREISEAIRRLHTFEDWAMLRRDMFESKLLGRSRDGSSYWLQNAEGSEVPK